MSEATVQRPDMGLHEPLPVRVIGKIDQGTEDEESILGSFRTIALLGTEAPFRLFAQDRKRKKSMMQVKNNLAAAPATTFPIPVQVVTANNQSSPVWDTGPLGDDITGVEVIISVTAVSGTTPTVQFMLQTSNDNNNWGNTTASPAITATGVQRWTATAPLDRYFRLLPFNIGGTTPSFTIQGTMSATTNVTVPQLPQSVLVGRQNQVSNNQGAVLYDGMLFVYEAESEVWCIPQAVNGAVILSIVEERRTPRE